MKDPRPAIRLRGPMLGSLAAHAAVAAALAVGIGWGARGTGNDAPPLVTVLPALAVDLERREQEEPLPPVARPAVEAPRVEERAEAVPETPFTRSLWIVPLPDFRDFAAPDRAAAESGSPPLAATAAAPEQRHEPAEAPVVMAPVMHPPRVDPAGCPAPAYPRLARQRELEGVALLLLQVGADGRVLQVRLLESSGHAILDEAALSAARAWRLTPATADGVAVAGALRVPLRFRLER